jgi:AcrR family transcriptional regulator
MIKSTRNNQRQIQKEQTRQLLIDTAFEQYALHGISATTSKDITSTAHLAHGTLFVHFSTQDEFITAVVEEFGKRVNTRLHELAAEDSSLPEVLRMHLLALREVEGFYTRLVVEGRLLPPSARYVYIGIQSAISYHICQILEREISTGKVMDAPVHLLFNTWLGLIHYYLGNNDLFAPGESVLGRYGEQILDHYLSMISIKR